MLLDQPGGQLGDAAPRQHCHHLPFTITHDVPDGHHSPLDLSGAAAREIPGADRAVGPPIGHTLVMLQIAVGHRRAVNVQISRRSTEHMPLAPQKAMLQRRRPDIRPTDPHDDIHALFDRIDKAVGEGNMRQQQRVFLHKLQNHRQRLQTPEGRRQVNADPALRLGIVGLHGQLGLLQFGQNPSAGPVKSRTGISQCQAPRGALEQAHPKPVFQPGDTLADRRGRQVQALGSSPEAARVGDTDKYIDTFQALGSEHARPSLVNSVHLIR